MFVKRAAAYAAGFRFFFSVAPSASSQRTHVASFAMCSHKNRRAVGAWHELIDSISDIQSRLRRVRHVFACRKRKPTQGHFAVHATGQEAGSARGRHAGTGGRINLALGWARCRSDHVLRTRNIRFTRLLCQLQRQSKGG